MVLGLSVIPEIRQIFGVFDKNNDNAISAAELGTVMRSLGANPTQIEIRELIKQHDKNSNLFVYFPLFNIYVIIWNDSYLLNNRVFGKYVECGLVMLCRQD